MRMQLYHKSVLKHWKKIRKFLNVNLVYLLNLVQLYCERRLSYNRDTVYQQSINRGTKCRLMFLSTWEFVGIRPLRSDGMSVWDPLCMCSHTKADLRVNHLVTYLKETHGGYL